MFLKAYVYCFCYRQEDPRCLLTLQTPDRDTELKLRQRWLDPDTRTPRVHISFGTFIAQPPLTHADEALVVYLWYLNASGLAELAQDRLHVTVNVPSDVLDAGAELTRFMRTVHCFCPLASVHLHAAGNQYEYQGIRKAWALGLQSTVAGHPDDVVLYLHSKGVTHQSASIPLLSKTTLKWGHILGLFSNRSMEGVVLVVSVADLH